MNISSDAWAPFYQSVNHYDLNFMTLNAPSFFCFLIVCFLLVQTSIAGQQDKTISLRAGNFEHITFKTIKASHYSFHDDVLKIDVDQSASFLMQSFDTVKHVSQVSFEWRSEGSPLVMNAKHEEKRKGDDAVFKLGLLLEADAQPFNPLLPKWMKRVQKLLRFPSEKMVYLVANAKHNSGESWANPYNKRVTMISVNSKGGNKGWMNASYTFRQPVRVVAVWLMADGDNTDSRFSSYVRNITVN